MRWRISPVLNELTDRSDRLPVKGASWPRSAVLCGLGLAVLAASASDSQSAVRARRASSLIVRADSSPSSFPEIQRIQRLEPGQPIERELASGEPHHYQLTVESGQYLHLRVDQIRIDLVVTLLSSDGGKIAQADNLNRTREPEEIFAVLESGGTYDVEVRSSKSERSSGRYRLEIEALRQATAQDRNRVVAEGLFTEGERLRAKGGAEALRQAVARYEEALTQWEAALDPGGRSKTMYSLGLTHRNLGARPKAIEYYEQALEIARSVGNHRREAVILTAIGSLYNSMGDTRKALDCLSRSLLLSRAAGDRGSEGVTFNNLGAVYRAMGDMQKALEHFNEALLIHQGENDLAEIAITLNNTGLVYDSLGQSQKALDYYDQALPIHRGLGDRDQEATTLTNIGLVYRGWGEWQKALEFYNDALAIRKERGDEANTAVTLNNIGVVYRLLGETEKALSYYNESLPLRRSVGDPRGEATTLSNIGAAHRTLGDMQKSLQYYEEALKLRRKVSDKSGEANTLSNIGLVYESLGLNEKALEYFNQAIPLRRQVGDKAGEAYTLTAMGAVYRSLEDHQKALEHLGRALDLRRAVQDRSGEAVTLYNLARVERQRGDLLQARAHMETALQIVDSLRTNVASQELRASYFASVQQNYEFYVDLLMLTHKQSPSQANDLKALQANERARARSLIEMLREARADIRRGVDPSLLERERILQRQMNDKADYQARLLGGRHTPEQAATVLKEIDALTIQNQQVEAQMRDKSPGYAALTRSEPLSLAQLQRDVLDRDTLLLEYALGSDRSYLWVVSQTSLTSYELPKRATIDRAARRVHELLIARQPVAGETDEHRRERIAISDAEYPAAALELSRTVLGPAAAQLGRKRLMIVPDGSLQYVPFGALPLPSAQLPTGGQPVTLRQPTRGTWQPLITEHEIVSLPSATVLATLRSELATRKRPPKAVAVFADPVFSSGDDRVAARRISPSGVVAGEPATDSVTLRGASETGVIGPGGAIPRLPFSRDEAKAILEAARPAGAMEAVGFRASRSMATSPELGLYRIVHFATHGLLNSEHPELSGVVLSLVDEQGNPQDGFLRLRDLYNLNLPVEMVVLSACQTALGKEIKGEGIVGLTRGFMYAGAPRVVASLWKVDDLGTAELMKHFYRGIFKEAMTPAAALRAAQAAMWKQRRWQAPYYWAGFVLHGEWR